MTTVPVVLRLTLEDAAEAPVLWLSRLPCVGEHVAFQGREYEVTRVTHGQLQQPAGQLAGGEVRLMEVARDQPEQAPTDPVDLQSPSPSADPDHTQC